MSSTSIRATGNSPQVARPCCWLHHFYFFIIRRSLGGRLGAKGSTGDPGGWRAVCWGLYCNWLCIDTVCTTYPPLNTVTRLTRWYDMLEWQHCRNITKQWFLPNKSNSVCQVCVNAHSIRISDWESVVCCADPLNHCKLFNCQYKSCSAATNINSRITLRGCLLCMSWPSILCAILAPSLRSCGSSCLTMVSKTMLNNSGARGQPYLKPVKPLTMVSSRVAL